MNLKKNWKTMGIQLLRIYSTKQSTAQKIHEAACSTPKGYVSVYVGETSSARNRFLVPLSHLRHPTFKELLDLAEEEFGSDHPITGGLAIPCGEQSFMDLTCDLRGIYRQSETS